MADKQIALVTGAAGYWGSRLAARLMQEPTCTVIGIDLEYPVTPPPRLDFIQADFRSPLLIELLRAETVDVVCHLAFRETRRPSEAAFELNITGTSKVLGACAGAGVHKVVIKGSMASYGARASNSAFLTEDQPLRGRRRYGRVRDLVEVETLCREFSKLAPEVLLTVLRFSSIVGPSANTPMTAYLKQPWAPSLWGFDPMIQIIHEEDVVEALAHAVLHDVPGTFNIAAGDALPLSKVRGLAGKPALAVIHKFVEWGRTLPLGERYFPIEPDYLRYSWVGDLSRMRRDFGFVPLHTAEETVREFGLRYHPERSRLGGDRGARADDRLQDIIGQRRRARERQASAAARKTEGAADE